MFACFTSGCVCEDFTCSWMCEEENRGNVPLVLLLVNKRLVSPKPLRKMLNTNRAILSGPIQIRSTQKTGPRPDVKFHQPLLPNRSDFCGLPITDLFWPAIAWKYQTTTFTRSHLANRYFLYKSRREMQRAKKQILQHSYLRISTNTFFLWQKTITFHISCGIAWFMKVLEDAQST